MIKVKSGFEQWNKNLGALQNQQLGYRLANLLS